jgi:hypothetical protein
MDFRNVSVLILQLTLAVSANAVAATNTICVGSTAELTSALAALPTSQTNSDATDIRVRVGLYTSPVGGWSASVTNHHDLTLHGGYQDAQCQQQSLDASRTVLDAHHTGTVLTIDTILTPSSNIEISGLTFENGDAAANPSGGSTAGGLKISDTGPIHGGGILVERNIFLNNTAGLPGAGALLAASDGTSLVVRGNLFAGNSAGNAAGAFVYSNNEIDVSNNTFAQNHSTDATLPKRVILDFFTFAGLKLDNNIFWDNATGGSAFDVDLHGQATGASAVNNDIQAPTGTPVQETNTLHVEPGFAGPGDYRLSSQSLLVNKGENTPPGGTSNVDLDGAQRIADAMIDLGAYERSGVFTNGFEIGGFISGNWFNPQQSGHGFQLEITTTGDMVAIWFVYSPDGSGQSWIFAEGPYTAHANTVTLPAQILTGARFPPNFRAADLHKQGNADWGTITFTFADCDNGQVSWHSDQPGYDQANDTPLAITRLTQIAGTVCPQGFDLRGAL